MKRALIFFLIFILFSGFSCQKEEKPSPVCTITNLQNEQEFYEDEDIPVHVSVDDKNSVITSVLLYIDNKSYTGTSEFPYNFTIKAGYLAPGVYTIKVVVRNKNGKQGESSVKVIVKEADSESPDFVSFSDGKLPKGWEADGWHITPTTGFDDFFSLFSNQENSKVKASKTCNYIEFYVYTLGTIIGLNLYLDGELWQAIYIPPWGNMKWWEFNFSCPDGFHTFEWELISPYIKGFYLDAIKFETKTE